MTDQRARGLAGVVAAESALSFIDGETGFLSYRGYDIHALARHASYLESVYLLWYDALPAASELAAFEGTLATQRGLPEVVRRGLPLLPDESSPMAALRTGVSMLGQVDPEADDISHEADLRKAGRLVAQMPTLVAAFDRIRKGLDPIDPDPELDHCANFLYMLTGERPGATAARALDTSLLLYLEHGLNASTFAARVVASTLADMHSAITAGVSALKGPLHGGANEKAMQMLLEIGPTGDASAFVDRALEHKKKIMGFGHRVYRGEDPRASHLRRMAEELSGEAGAAGWYDVSRALEKAMLERKGLHCNVDFYCATVYYSLGLPIDLFTPLFAIGRTAGWAAHVMEQHMHNRLIRPRAEYTGELDRPWVPIDRR
ncbi:MAG: citrate synthase [Gemmatimonadetes bacterium]|nr:citrate synthase [Gemmatimonadota bacterium]MBT8477398.1 citrate synthase [Gemmatimonadota bacterium]